MWFHKRQLIWFVLLSAAALTGYSAEPLAARWEGSVQIPGNELIVVVDLAPDANGTWTGSITMPELNTKGLPLKDVVVNGSEASFATKSTGGRGLEATFKAHLSGSNKLTGEFSEAGNTAPFELKQTGPPQVETLPRSTPIKKEIEGEWHGEFQLFGYPRKVTLKLANNGDKGSGAEFVVVGKRVNNLPVDLVTLENNLLTVHSHETGIVFEGRCSRDGKEIRGTFSQGPIDVPLTLHRK